MIRVSGSVSKAWMAGTIGATFDKAYYFEPRSRYEVDTRCQRYLDENLKDLKLLFTESNLGRRSFWRPNQILVGGIQPNMILGMLLGAEFLPGGRMDADISSAPLAGKGPDDLPPIESLLEHLSIRRFDTQYQSLKLAGDVEPIPPFFWDGSGRAAIHGSLTTAQKLFGESIFLDMATDVKRVEAIFDWITEASIGLARHFAQLADRPIDEAHVGECSGCMVSPKLYERLVVPTLSRIGRELGPVRWHSCGASDHLLDAAARIDRLSELDLGGGTSVSRVRKIFGPKTPVCIAPLVDDLLAAEPKGLLGWVDRVLDANAGGPLTVNYHLEPGYSLDHLRRLHERVLVAASDAT